MTCKGLRACVVTAVVAAAALAAAAPSQAERAVGVSVSSDVLLSFDTQSPGSMSARSVIGLGQFETVRGLDLNPVDGRLYALVINDPDAGPDSGRLFRVDVTTGLLSPVGSAPFSSELTDNQFYGMDFDPMNGQARVVNGARQNLRVNPTTGALVAADPPLDNPAVDDENVRAIAYSGNIRGARSTALYGVDFANDQLVRIAGQTPGGNTALTPIGPFGIVTDDAALSFDVSSSGTAYMSGRAGGVPTVFRVNLGTGMLTPVARMAAELGSFAILPPLPAAPPAPPAAPPPPDTQRPEVLVALDARQPARTVLRRRRLRLEFSCNEACSATGQLRTRSRRARMLASGARSLSKAGKGTLTLRLNRRGRQQLTSLMKSKRRKSLVLRLTLTVRDRAGNPTAMRRTVRLMG